MPFDILTTVCRRVKRALHWGLPGALVSVALLLQLPMAVQAQDENTEIGPQHFNFLFENDLFGDSDAQYTNGLKLTWLSPDLKSLEGAPGLPRWLHSLVSRLNAFERAVVDDHGRQFNIGFGIGQMMYTPDDTQTRDLVVDDRPYAGWLYGALTLVSKTDSVADMFEVQLGMIGSASLAEQAQKFVHDVRDLPSPRGWSNQLDNEPGLLLYYERRWRLLRSDLFRGFEYDAFVHAGLALGNVADYAALGAEFRVGWHLPRDFGTSLIRPGGDASAPSAISSTDVRDRRLGVYTFAAFGGRAVARDIFLDGNTFSDSHDVNKKHFVGDLVIGASVVYGAAKLSYAQVFRSREFDGQDRVHNYGSVSLSFSF